MGNQPAGSGDRPFDGLIDEVRIYSQPLSVAEIAWLAGKTEPFDKPF
ncbi:MAG: LamG-like jellyroll fold domain-containing protein [Planctomycetota bacterium]